METSSFETELRNALPEQDIISSVNFYFHYVERESYYLEL